MLFALTVTWIAALVSAGGGPESRPGYDIELLTKPAGADSVATGIGRPGFIGGWIDSGTWQACLWIDGELQLLNGPHVEAVAGNGIAVVSNHYRYHHGTGTYVFLPSLIGAGEGAVWDVNSSGFAVGISPGVPGGKSDRAVLWDRNGAPRDLGSLGAGSVSAQAINELGWVVGHSGTGGKGRRPYIWKEGVMHELPLPPSLDTGEGFAYDVNDLGMVVGYSRDLKRKAVLWVDGVPQTLDPRLEIAREISNLGQILADGFEEQFLWVEGHVFRVEDLTEIPGLWKFDQAYDIGDDGCIVGSVIGQAGKRRGFLMTPKKANLNLDATLDRADAALFATSYLRGVALADMNRDGAIDGSDLWEFIASFREGR